MAEDQNDKVKVIKGVLDKITLYINPEMFMKENKDIFGDRTTEKTNMEFSAQQAHGRLTGEMPQDTEIAKALKRAAESEANKDPGNTLYLSGDLDNPATFGECAPGRMLVPVDQRRRGEQPVPEDDDVLG